MNISPLAGNEASVTPVYGIYPIGGDVDGIYQMKEHGDKAKHLPHGMAVRVSEVREVQVTTYGNFINNKIIRAVQVHGCWYLAEAFEFA